MANKQMTQQDLDNYKQSIAPYQDKDGWFPDEILGDSIWILSIGEKNMVEDKLYWRIVRHKI